MAKIFGQLEYAQLENIAGDSTSTATGIVWWDSTGKKTKLYDGTNIRALLRNDGYCVLGNDGTAANNIRLHRGANAVLQLVTGDDVTAEGSLSTSLAQVSAKLETYVTGSLPAAGVAGRLAYDSTVGRPKFDNGAIWSALDTGGTTPWTEVTGTTQTISNNNAYIANNAARVVFTLPATSSVGDRFIIVGKGAGGWKIAQNASQYLIKGTAMSITGTSGSIESAHAKSCIEAVCVEANLGYQIMDSEGISTILSAWMGSLKGYCCPGTYPAGAQIDDLVFSGETSTRLGTTMNTGKSAGAGVWSDIKGYTMGGYTGSSSSGIDYFTYSDESTVGTLAATINTARAYCSSTGMVSSTKGYMSGGGANNVIDDLIFSGETSSQLAATLTTNRNSTADINSDINGYICGGANPLSSIDKFVFTSENISALGNSLPVTRGYAVPVCSTLKAYIGGGYIPSTFTGSIVGFTFATELAANITATLDGSVDNAGAGCGNPTKGYYMNQVNTTANIDDQNYSTESSDRIAATLDSSSTYKMGFNN